MAKKRSEEELEKLVKICFAILAKRQEEESKKDNNNEFDNIGIDRFDNCGSFQQ